MELDKKELDWWDKKGNLVIVNGIAQRDIEADEELVSYGKIWKKKYSEENGFEGF